MPFAEVGDPPFEDRIVLKSQYHERDLIEQVPGARWAAKIETGRWTVPLAWTSGVVLRSLFGDRLEVGPRLAAWRRREVETRVRPSLEWRERLDAPPPFEDATAAWPHVRAGVWWMWAAQDGLLLDDVGGGKSVQTALALRGLDGPHLIVAPKVMLRTWKREVEKWWPGAQVSIISGTAKERRAAIAAEADVYVITWANLIKHSRLAPYGSTRLAGCARCEPQAVKPRSPENCERHEKELNAVAWGCIVADEVHRAKNPKAKQTRALWYLGDRARHRWGLTGTSITDRTDESWTELRFAAPHEWPDHGRYIDRWCDTNWTGWGIEVVGLKPSTMQEFDRCALPRWRRVPAAIFRGERPEPNHQERLIELTPQQRRAYDQMAKGLVAEAAGGGTLTAFDPLAQVLRLWQLASACVTADGQLVEPSNKLDALLEVLEDVAPEPVVCFAQHRRLLELVMRRLERLELDYVTIVGGQTEDERDQAVLRFQAGKVPLLLATYGAGGEGITLNRSHVMVTLQDSWVGKDNHQAVGRLDRGETEKRVEVVHLRSADTLDEVVPLKAGQKDFRLEQFVRDAEAVVRLVTNREEPS